MLPKPPCGVKIVSGLTTVQIFLEPQAQRGRYIAKFNVLNLSDVLQGNIYESYNAEKVALSQNGLNILDHFIPGFLIGNRHLLRSVGGIPHYNILSKQTFCPTKMLEGFGCDLAAACGAVKVASLEEEGFVHVFECGFFLLHGCGQCFYTYWSTVEFI